MIRKMSYDSRSVHKPHNVKRDVYVSYMHEEFSCGNLVHVYRNGISNSVLKFGIGRRERKVGKKSNYVNHFIECFGGDSD
jgi:hypothetical protein